MRLIDADRLKLVLEKNFGEIGGNNVLQQIIDKQPTIKPSASEWHVVAEGDLPPKLKDGERAKTYLITKNDAQKYIDFAFWDGEAFGRERKCNIVVSGVLAWRELPEPWEGVSERAV
ncbi:hypothetical protein [Eubacterium callanderi]|uniref:hypothetical protein n=1 Tax=Eubacterium callanderi TaxID=53442 RepID=UPI001D4E704A|nr:hypothetical protein [Eubacterium limosum]